ncbi:MAG TPA: efflux RND transporter periplasmic adaptor subunit [Bacteroidales bacterium]|nr:efflux RND transporter periplasmic adaptor subunit [Bacteroidales bacterium]
MKVIPIIIIIAFFISCKPKKTEDLEEMARRTTHREAVVVKSVKLEPSTFYHELISNGKAFSCNKAIIPFKVNGIINNLHIINGQRVKMGELLATIEDYEYNSKVENAKRQLKKAEVDFNDELWTKYNTDDTTKLSPDKIRTTMLRSNLGDARVALKEAEYNLNNTRIYSPISGVIANLDATVWNPTGNYKNLCTVISDENMYVEFPVIESEYSFIYKDMSVGIIPFIEDSVTITGRITQINPQVDENGMIKVRAEFRNTGRIIDGMNTKILIRKSAPNRLVVPKEALVIRQGKDVVFVRQDSLAIWKYVNVEFENSSTVSIKEGLEAGDLVIVAGNINLAHETVVKEQ